MDDGSLLAATARGDLASFRALVDRHLGAVAGLARHMLRDDAEAEDVAQEALLRLWRTADSIEVPAAGLRPWLRRVAANLCIDRVRSGRRWDVVEEVPEVVEPPTQSHGLEQADVARRIQAALAALPDRQRMALTLFHYEGLSQSDIAGIMGITDEAVESLLSRARRGLKVALKDEWMSLLAES
jgi:RNA polymerase sigma-70 factor (ECF subfamily)